MRSCLLDGENRFQHGQSKYRARRPQVREKRQRDARLEDWEGKRGSRPTTGIFPTKAYTPQR